MSFIYICHILNTSLNEQAESRKKKVRTVGFLKHPYGLINDENGSVI